MTGVFVLFFVTACAEENPTDNTAAKQTDQSVQAGNNSDQTQGIMDQPVDFSTPEAFEESMQRITEQGGEKSRKSVENAMKYIMYYDIYVSGDEAKLHKKLNGKTPNQIIAMMKK